MTIRKGVEGATGATAPSMTETCHPIGNPGKQECCAASGTPPLGRSRSRYAGLGPSPLPQAGPDAGRRVGRARDVRIVVATADRDHRGGPVLGEALAAPA